VPLDVRRTWNDTNLFGWWAEAINKHPRITWERCPGNQWQHVKGMCRDLIGE